jgi:hypothetical protein
VLRLSFDLGIPAREILVWPAWQIDAYLAFTRVEPPPLQRIEMILAQMAADFVNANREQGASAAKRTDYLLPRDLWGADAPVGSDLTTEELQMIGLLDDRPE